uniref:Profilin n=1 Tax=Anopheles minimus TaxID=112268 RepID=A0A182WGT2_9DIPT
MSWQDYVDNQLLASQCVSKAAIAGHDGGVWAKSEGFEGVTDEMMMRLRRLQRDGRIRYLSTKALSNYK